MHGTRQLRGGGVLAAIYHYSKWDPCGNTTLFLHEEEKMPAELVACALGRDQLDCEQAGYVDTRRQSLRMAGGEFCVNATRALGALLAAHAARAGRPTDHFTVTVSGWPGEIELFVAGGAPSWRVTAALAFMPSPSRLLEQGISLVRLPGISHLLVGPDAFPKQGHVQKAQALLSKYGLLDEPAAGVIWWEAGASDGLRILPVVHVREVGTLFEETSCGSGSLALACLVRELGMAEMCRVAQPGGDSLDVHFTQSDGRELALVGGRVGFVEQGVWRP